MQFLKTNKSIRGFTLAEVLITLAVIGVVAAITIPALQNHIDNAQHRAALEKAYSVISNAANLIKQENGGTLKELCLSDDSYCLREKLAQKLNVTKKCLNSNTEGCWASEWFEYDGDKYPADSHSFYGMVLNDGMFIKARYTQSDCTDWFGRCGYMIIDTNGEKAPNKNGYDVHWFHVLENKIDPMGGIYEAYPCSDAGYGCTAKMLLKGL